MHLSLIKYQAFTAVHLISEMQGLSYAKPSSLPI